MNMVYAILLGSIVANIALIFLFVRKKSLVREMLNSDITAFEYVSRADDNVRILYNNDKLDVYEIVINMRFKTKSYICNSSYQLKRVNTFLLKNLVNRLLDLYEEEIKDTEIINNIIASKDFEKIENVNNFIKKMLDIKKEDYNFIYRINNFIKISYKDIFILIDTNNNTTNFVDDKDKILIEIHPDNIVNLNIFTKHIVDLFKSELSEAIEINGNIYSRKYAEQELNIEILDFHEDEYYDDEDEYGDDEYTDLIDKNNPRIKIKKDLHNIDFILDKIAKYGYDTLSEEEKQFLNNYSK